MNAAEHGHIFLNLFKKYKRYKKAELQTIGDKFLNFVILLSVFFTVALIVLSLSAIAFDI
jgi:hypothetical protein